MAVEMDKKMKADLKTLARFVEVYCDGQHKGEPRNGIPLKDCDVDKVAGKKIELCTECSKLLTHAFVKRMSCPQDPKPMCKNCTDHCYYDKYRDQIKEVMKYSGKKLVMTGRIDYLLHLLF